MRRKQIEKVPVKVPDGMGKKAEGKRVAVQLSGKYLILDLWKDGVWTYRHVTDTDTGEYASYAPGNGWTSENLKNAFDKYYWGYIHENEYQISGKDRKLVLDALDVKWACRDVYGRIESLEQEYADNRREQKEWRRTQRIRELMDGVPEAGKEIFEWIEEKAAGSLHYAVWDKESGDYYCTACGGRFRAAADVRMRHKETAGCPLCHRNLAVEKRRLSLSMETRLTLIHDLDEKRGIQRHFIVTVTWALGLPRTVALREIMRCMLHKGAWSRYQYDIYYLQYGEWDNRGNPCNLRWKTGYLYPEGIREGMEKTAYHAWADVFRYMASMGMRANYDRLLADSREHFVQMVEYLAKGRFCRLLEEVSEEASYYHGYGSYNSLNVSGEDIREVMHIRDMQKIVRLRQEDGGINMLEWLQWADREKKKIGSGVLAWYGKNGISNGQYGNSRASRYLSPEQLMNYIARQVKESYGGKRKAGSVFETYEDYLSMSAKLGKNLSDPMVYRPRELKRRHEEAVEEHRKYLEALRLQEDMENARKAAERMEEKYPGSVEILESVREKYEYEGENYLITVPRNFYEITMEGMALHHCVGNTERYFDRILQHETYICFLRRKEEPEKAFYTIEVEPGGTIRQHRGYLDEEPGIEEIKPFLREWQKEIRRKMSRKDMEHAQLSAIKREQNLEELRQKNNTRVLEALMEDLMEAI